MPKQKDLKRLIRTRMQKTGESYTAARSQILDKSSPAPAEYAAIAGMSDEAVRAKTGRTWRQWVRQLDAIGAVRMPHREIAKHLNESNEISGWWATRRMNAVGKMPPLSESPSWRKRSRKRTKSSPSCWRSTSS